MQVLGELAAEPAGQRGRLGAGEGQVVRPDRGHLARRLPAGQREAHAPAGQHQVRGVRQRTCDGTEELGSR
ncbi:hypothetical protein [Lentzea roselyniae]|uniref:hypothetical protein n=1 Tax=Lentzea roselyniae TaxID=531940 RepID=UPI000DD463F5